MSSVFMCVCVSVCGYVISVHVCVWLCHQCSCVCVAMSSVFMCVCVCVCGYVISVHVCVCLCVAMSSVFMWVCVSVCVAMSPCSCSTSRDCLNSFFRVLSWLLRKTDQVGLEWFMALTLATPLPHPQEVESTACWYCHISCALYHNRLWQGS